MSIQFPILNISLSNLSSQDLEETHIGDLWDYPGDNSIFEEYYNNQKYVDQSGHIFKIIGKRKSNFINSIIHFSNVQKITSAENLQSRASDEIVPFREFIIKDDTSALL